MWIDQRGADVLSRPECLRLLALAAKENHVGRLAVADLQAPLVVPLNFTFHERLVFVRIGPGRVSELAPGALVAFEIDKVAPSRGLERFASRVGIQGCHWRNTGHEDASSVGARAR